MLFSRRGARRCRPFLGLQSKAGSGVLEERSGMAVGRRHRRAGDDASRIVTGALALILAGAPMLPAQHEVRVAYRTPAYPDANVDSCVSWIPLEGGTPLLFITEKDGDRIQVRHAATGDPYVQRPFLGGVIDSGLPGQFNRPNGVWVAYHVPAPGGFADILLVTDQTNQRVQIFRLPELEYFGEFGTGQVGKGYGLSWYQDGTDHLVFITDNSPPAGFPGKIKKYRLRPEGARLGADLLFAVGSSSGVPALPNVESIAADLFHDRLHVCGDEGGRLNWIFRLDGTYTGTVYGDPQFEWDQEGINIYDTGGGSGYILISDQYRDSSPNQFELFDRATVAPLGNFESAPGGIITRNTDGAFLEQRGFPGFPNGAFYAVHDDREAHAYDWTDIAEEVGLRIVALDRSFVAAAPGGSAPPRAALWFHDGSWWVAHPRGDAEVIARLEDGAFRPQVTIGSASPASVRSRGGSLYVLRVADVPHLLVFRYEPWRRAYAELGGPVDLPQLEGPLADLEVEPTRGDDARVWVVGVADGDARVVAVAPESGGEPSVPIVLGSSAPVLPRWVPLADGVGILWTDGASLLFRRHQSADPPESWAATETVASGDFESIAAAGDGSGVVVIAVAADGDAHVWRRSAAGLWSNAGSLTGVGDAALVVDASRSRIHLIHAVGEAHRLVRHREAALSDLSFGPERLLIGWPGVDQDCLLYPSILAAEALDLVAAALGSDGLGYFGRVPVPAGPDRIPPISWGHTPAPGSTGVPEGAEVSFRITDDGAGVDRDSLRLLVNDVPVTPQVRGVPGNFLVSFRFPSSGLGTQVRLRIEAADRATDPNEMVPFEYELGVASTTQVRFRRGDTNDDSEVDLSDGVRVLLFLFGGVDGLRCDDAGDVNDDGRLDLSDSISLLNYLFLGGPALPAPGLSCGADADGDLLDCDSSPCG